LKVEKVDFTPLAFLFPPDFCGFPRHHPVHHHHEGRWAW